MSPNPSSASLPLTEMNNPATVDIDTRTTREMLELIHAQDRGVMDAVAVELARIAEAVDAVYARMEQGGRLIYVGAGTSGRLGVVDASEMPPTFGVPRGIVIGLIAGGETAMFRSVEGAEDHPESGRDDIARLEVNARDAVVGIAASGRTPYVIGALEEARTRGALTVSLACATPAPIHAFADINITPLTGPEVIEGSTRLKAGTATKLVLNMLSTAVMIKLGKTYGNLMVDLQPTNQKLRDRARRIVERVTALSTADAQALLDRCGDVKTAIIAHHARVSPEEARARLQAARGSVRRALASSRGSMPRARGSVRRAMIDDLVLGIDGGGSRTRAFLADRDGKILGRGEAGASNPLVQGFAAAQRELETAIAHAFDNANLMPERAAALCLGLGGAGHPREQHELAQWARTTFAERVEVVTDGEIVLAAGSPENWGIALIAGTGSFAWGRNRAGKAARAGGWGYILGDEGSGYDLARQSLRAVAQAADGRGEPTQLLQAILGFWNLNEPMDLIGHVYRSGLKHSEMARLAPLVISVAERGDLVARRLVEDAAASLARALAATSGALELNDLPFPLALTGGLLLGSEFLRAQLFSALERYAMQVAPVNLVPHPAMGAVRLALELARPEGSIN